MHGYKRGYKYESIMSMHGYKCGYKYEIIMFMHGYKHGYKYGSFVSGDVTDNHIGRPHLKHSLTNTSIQYAKDKRYF